MVWGVRYLQEAHGLDYGDGGAALGDGAARLDHRLPAARVPLRSDRPAQAGHRRRRGRAARLPRLDPLRHAGVFPPYVLGLVAGIASGAAMLPYTVIKEANPPELSGTATGVVNFLNFTFSALLGPVFAGLLVAASGGAAPMTLEHYQTAFQPLLYGVALAIVLTFFLKETGPARTRRGPHASDGDAMTTAQTGTGKYEQLLERCRSLEPVATAVAHPCEATALAGAIEAAAQGLIAPILVGPAAKIREVAEAHGIDLGGVADRRRAAQPCGGGRRRSTLVRQGEAELLMKGSLHTDELLGAVVARETGLRTGRRISHVFIMDVPTYHKVLIVTDAAINIAPTLEDKVDICQNAIDLAVSLGVAAAEGRDPRRGRDGQLEDAGDDRRRGAVQDGRARPDHGRPARWSAGLRQRDQQGGRATIKGITSEVAGDPDILLAPDLEAGNILAKQLTFLANADSAGLVLGARVPIILTSRADSVRVADRELRRRGARGACAAAARRPCRLGDRHGRLRARPQRRLVEPEVLRLPAARRRRRGGSRRAARSTASARRRASRRRTRPATRIADETLDAGGQRRTRRARRAGGLAARPLRRRARRSASAIASSTAAPRYAGPTHRHAARCSTSCAR